MVDHPVWPFVTGSLAGMLATTCTHPADMVKLRAGATETAGFFASASKMLKNEGLTAFYKGSAAGLTRQVFYSGASLGLFDKFTAVFKEPGKPMSFAGNAGCALSAAGLAAVFANPVDVAVLARMQDVKPAAERAGSMNVTQMVLKIAGSLDTWAKARTESRRRVMFMKGDRIDWPTANRAMALYFGMLAFNASAKDTLAGAGATGLPQVICASWIAGIFASFFSCPFDLVKSQMKSQIPDPVTGELPFKSSIDCAIKLMAEGGPLRLYAGFPTFYFRVAPHAMITLIAQDAIKKGWSN